MIKLSELPKGINSAEEMVDYMLDVGEDTLVNDNTITNMEYGIDDVLDSYKFLSQHYMIVQAFKQHKNSKRIPTEDKQ
jgi:hypothetical protein